MAEVLVLCVFAFLAGLVDAVAGGGGLIQLPALMAVYPSAPPALLLGTNKLSSIGGTAVATLRYGWSVPIRWKLVVPAAAIAGLGALLGANTMTLIEPGALRPVVLVLLVTVATYTLLQRRFGWEPRKGFSPQYEAVGLVTLGAVVGFYDGFFGPGAGSFLMFGLIRFFGYDFLRAAAASKVLNLATNFGALVLFLATDNVLYVVGLPMGLFNVVGGLVGAQIAVRRGSRFIRAIFLVVVIGLIGKITFDLLKQG